MALTIGQMKAVRCQCARRALPVARTRPVLGAVLGAVLATSAALAPAREASCHAASAVVIWGFEDHTAAAAASASAARRVAFLLRTLPDAVLETLLAAPTLQVVDRLRLQDILAEQKLGSSALSDEATRLKLGRLIGAQCMVFGGFMAVGDDVQVTLRVVDASSTEVVFADQFTAEFDDVLAQTQHIAGDVALALGGHPSGSLPVVPDEMWLEYERALALNDAGHVQEAIDVLKDLLSKHPDFAAAERQLVNLYARLARQ